MANERDPEIERLAAVYGLSYDQARVALLARGETEASIAAYIRGTADMLAAKGPASSPLGACAGTTFKLLHAMADLIEAGCWRGAPVPTLDEIEGWPPEGGL